VYLINLELEGAQHTQQLRFTIGGLPLSAEREEISANPGLNVYLIRETTFSGLL
jgi:hypothetical protein